jgi:hypothetical protein
MPGFLLHVGATVTCAHAGQAKPILSNPRVKVANQGVVTSTCVYGIVGCTFPPPPAANGPCVNATWTPGTAAIRVKANGMAVLLQSSQALCTPTGTPLAIVRTQTRVKGM